MTFMFFGDQEAPADFGLDIIGKFHQVNINFSGRAWKPFDLACKLFDHAHKLFLHV